MLKNVRQKPFKRRCNKDRVKSLKGSIKKVHKGALFWYNEKREVRGRGKGIMVKTKNLWVLLLCMLAGLTVGNFVGELCSQTHYFKFFHYSQCFGLDTPLTIDLGILIMTFQFQLKFTLMGILGMLIGIFLYKKI